MSDEESKPQGETTTSSAFEWIAKDRVCEVYADWYHVNWMPLTVRMRFAQFISVSNKISWVLDERAAITMPYSTAKALCETLTSIITAYEKENGPIVIPNIPTVS
jgi:hypothetical protein